MDAALAVSSELPINTKAGVWAPNPLLGLLSAPRGGVGKVLDVQVVCSRNPFGSSSFGTEVP